MNLHTYKSLLVLCVCFYIIYGQDVGQPCTHRRTQETGVCQLLDKCASAIKILNSGGRPTKCGFVGNMPVVCCDKKAGDISKEKCHEYAQYVTEKVKRPNGMIQTISTCGLSTIALIVGGVNAQPKEFPHQAYLGYGPINDKTWKCGGSLISENFVLTAAHCCNENDPPRYVLLGELNIKRNDEDASPEEFGVSNIIIHPKYTPPQRYHDIALLKLNRQVRFNKYIRPACLHTTFDIEKKPSDLFVKFLASGWGKTDFLADSGSDVLQKVVVEEFTIDECREIFKTTSKRVLKNGIDSEIQLCAGGKREKKDTCPGDSGGPLQIYSTTEYCTYKIVGVTSFGKACGSEGVPGIYTRVSHYVNWIEQNVWSK